jgi:ABC-2 type transport system ATP-binding protein
MKQKLALACTLVHTPELLVLDEPTTGVDPVSRRDFWRILAGLQRAGLTLLLTTPYLDEAERCGRVALMDRGRFLSLDTPEALRQREAGSVVEVLARPRRAAQDVLSSLPEVTDLEIFGERLHATLGRTPRNEAAAAAERLAQALRAAGIEVEAVRSTLPSLEDIFIARIRASA